MLGASLKSLAIGCTMNHNVGITLCYILNKYILSTLTSWIPNSCTHTLLETFLWYLNSWYGHSLLPNSKKMSAQQYLIISKYSELYASVYIIIVSVFMVLTAVLDRSTFHTKQLNQSCEHTYYSHSPTLYVSSERERTKSLKHTLGSLCHLIITDKVNSLVSFEGQLCTFAWVLPLLCRYFHYF